MALTFRTILATELGQEYWQHTAQGRLPLRECLVCGRKRLYLTRVCPICASTQWQWTAASGVATVYAATMVRYRLSAEFPEQYVLALVDLDEGVRMMTNVAATDLSDVPIGARVRLSFDALPDGKQLPEFVLD